MDIQKKKKKMFQGKLDHRQISQYILEKKNMAYRIN